MLDLVEILNENSRSVDRVAADASTLIEVTSNVAPLRDTNIKSTLDINEQYTKERNSCDEYRLMLTIKPYCTNILFNACTEAVRNEGSDEADAVIGNDYIDSKTIKKIKNKIKGKSTSDVSIYDMIRNTEYSREAIGFEYHPGLDIFNNHILRNKTYRTVNDTIKTDVDSRKIFNTIADIMRTPKGETLTRCCRKSVSDTTMTEKHLYDKDNILPFYTGEAISENIREENGWVGFYNTTTISAKDRKGNDMDISRVINSRGNCEFIDMYPDRTLFSFVPKYNAARNRLEHNWEYAITYAFDSTTKYTDSPNDDIKLVQDKNVNALAIITVEYAILPNGSSGIFFRCATKHNLKPQDRVYIYFNEDEEQGNWKKSCNVYLVSGLGDINHKYEDYYFFISNTDLLEEIFCTPYLCDINSQQVNRQYDAWDYVRDYFYEEYTGSDIPDELFVEYPDQTPQKYNVGDVIRRNDKFYVIDGYNYILYEDKQVIFSGNTYYEYDTTTQQYIAITATQDITVPDDNDQYYYRVVEKYAEIVANVDIIVSDYTLYNDGYIILSGNTYYEYDTTTQQYIAITATQDITVPNNNNQYYYRNSGFYYKYGGGLTNIPTESDTYIKVKNLTDTQPKKYILFNHDQNVQYDETQHDASAFIRGIINNAFTDNDGDNSNSEVNQSMDGLWSDYISFRFVKTNGKYDCSYYVRKFKQILARDGGTLTNETYPLAFSDTIYGDKIIQSVYTDTIKTSSLKDNLGRNLTEVFLTIVKTNKGYEKWYGKVIDNETDSNVFDDPDIEYSHCFGPVTCGFELLTQNDDTKNVRETREDFIDVGLINVDARNTTIPSDEVDTTSITVDNDWFYGDVVEFCPWTCEETPVSDVCFRFNTAQREYGDEIEFKFDEIDTDDYDSNGFKICTYKVVGGVHRPEGYYYKAHYRIPLAELGPVQQAAHPYLSVYDVKPIQSDGIYLMVTTNQKHHILTGNGDKVLLRDTKAENTPEWWLDVVYVVNDYTFVMKTISRDCDEYRDWISITKNLKDNKYTLRAQNMAIPRNAIRLGINTYLWRDTVKLADSESEYNKYVFTNNALYVDKCFNFYLKRQDPYKVNGLYFDGSKCTIACDGKYPDTPDNGDCTPMTAVDKWFVGDIAGKTEKENDVYEYNDTQYTEQC